MKTDRKIIELFKEISSGKPFSLYKPWVKQVLASTKRHTSYLINPIPLVNSKGVTDRDKVFYLGLASMRSYNRYVLYNEKHLDIRVIGNPDLLEAIKNNPLLTINDNNIHFKYEEN